jgi:CRP-like cAMP-binding protein
MFVIAEGKVRISKSVPGIGEEALAILEAGRYFGEMAVIEDSPRSADAIARTLSERLRETNDKIKGFFAISRF